MEMSEMIVIDDDDGLEEGEIADDLPEIHKLNCAKFKEKKLPRRYVLDDQSSNSKHKYTKHKRKSKFNSLSKFSSMHKKKHKSSCPHHSFKKYAIPPEPVGTTKRELSSFDLNRRENHFSSSKIKSAFKNYTSPPRTALITKKISQNNHENSENEDNFCQLLTEYTKVKEKLNQKNEKDINQNDKSLQNCDSKQTISNEMKPVISSTVQNSHEKLPSDATVKKNDLESDEEDVEELRRIALSTCAKRSITDKDSLKSSEEVNSSVSCSPNEAMMQINRTFKVNSNNDLCDNNTVVDMEIDDDENSESGKNNLYVIDKNPMMFSEFSEGLHRSEFVQNKDIYLPNTTCDSPVKNEVDRFTSSRFQSSDDFEEELLRAELIASMNSRRKAQSPPENLDSVKEKVSENFNILENTFKTEVIVNNVVENTFKKEVIVNNVVENILKKEVTAKPCGMYSREPLKNSKVPSKGIIQAKSNFSKLKSNKVQAQPPRSINATQERLIITLNNDTTSEESDEETEIKKAHENVPVSSIEALISNARHNSDKIQTNSVNSNSVSYLSKAQQEEYNSLKKILAEKEPMSVQTPVIKEKYAADQSQLNFLLEKISAAKKNLEKEIVLRDNIEKEVLKKKQSYVSSKQRVLDLKQKWQAAEKLRATNLESWKQSSAKLDILKKSVSTHESLLHLLETELSNRRLHHEHSPGTPPI